MILPDQHIDRRTTVLLIEDDRVYAEIVRAYLRHPVAAGLEHVRTDRLERGLVYLESGGIDVVLLDLQLPDSRGYVTFQRLRESFPEVPIIILTALEDDGLARRAVRNGAQDYLFKIDLTPALLARSIRYAVERRHAEQALRARERRFRALVEDQTELVCCCLPDGELSFVNQAFSRWFDVPAEELVGSSLLELFSEDDRVALATHLGTLDRERPFRARRQRVRREGDEVRWLEWTDRALFDDDGELVELLSVGRDVTARQRLEEHLERTQRFEVIGGLVGNITHDFNNILTAVMGYADLLGLRLRGREDACAKELGELQTVARRAASLTGQLVAFSRRQIVRPEVLDLNRLVRDIDKIVRQLFDQRVTLEVMLDPEALWVDVDRGRIEQVVVNLALNSRDAMSSGGRLSIATRSEVLEDRAAADLGLRPGQCAVLEIADTGCGIEGEVAPRIFEPFFSTKSAGRGSGLGLSIVRRILSACGGAIAVESEPGVGSTFRVYLPSVLAPSVPDRRDAAAQAGDRTVLFVEDDPAVRTTLEAILRRHGYRVRAVATAEEALETVGGEESWDLLLTDFGLPGLNGVELADEVTAASPETRVLLITGRALETHPDRGVQSSEMPLLMKPFSAERLLEKLGEVLAE